MQSKKFYGKLGESNLKSKKEKLDSKNIFLIKKFKSTGLTILDLGCGKGYLSYEFAKRGNRVVAIDASESMLNYAKTKNNHKNITYIRSEFKQLRLRKNTFRLVFAINTLVHIRQLGPIFEEIRDLLKRDGKFILCFPHPLQDINSIKDYSKEQILKSKTRFGVVKQYYRPIQFYINKLIESKFLISKVYEIPSKKPYFFIIESRLD
jgi:ubiquinone/menaquinone biosynthesis C-methylase UbiE